MRSLLFIIPVISISILSCSKHLGDIEPPPPAAIISFSNPLPGSVAHAGDTVRIQAIAIASNNIHGYDFWINEKNDTAKIFFRHVHDHNDTLRIDQKWGNSLNRPADLEAQVLLYLDHDGHTFSRKVAFKLQ